MTKHTVTNEDYVVDVTWRGYIDYILKRHRRQGRQGTRGSVGGFTVMPCSLSPVEGKTLMRTGLEEVNSLSLEHAAS